MGRMFFVSHFVHSTLKVTLKHVERFAGSSLRFTRKALEQRLLQANVASLDIVPHHRAQSAAKSGRSPERRSPGGRSGHPLARLTAHDPAGPCTVIAIDQAAWTDTSMIVEVECSG